MSGNLDLFGHPMPSPKGRGAPSERRSIGSNEELAETVRKLALTDLTRKEIAREAGIGQASLYLHFFSEIGVGRGKLGRPAHAPTAASRQAVVEMSGLSTPTIAAALGISAPTLRKHYRAEINKRNPK